MLIIPSTSATKDDGTEEENEAETAEDSSATDTEEQPTEAAKEIIPVSFVVKQFKPRAFEMVHFFGNVDDDVKGTIEDNDSDDRKWN